MKKVKFKKGELVWVPSNITLTQMDNEKTVSKWKTIDSPTNAVVLSGPIGAYYAILHEGERWLARSCDLWTLTEE